MSFVHILEWAVYRAGMFFVDLWESIYALLGGAALFKFVAAIMIVGAASGCLATGGTAISSGIDEEGRERVDTVHHMTLNFWAKWANQTDGYILKKGKDVEVRLDSKGEGDATSLNEPIGKAIEGVVSLPIGELLRLYQQSQTNHIPIPEPSGELVP